MHEVVRSILDTVTGVFILYKDFDVPDFEEGKALYLLIDYKDSPECTDGFLQIYESKLGATRTNSLRGKSLLNCLTEYPQWLLKWYAQGEVENDEVLNDLYIDIDTCLWDMDSDINKLHGNETLYFVKSIGGLLSKLPLEDDLFYKNQFVITSKGIQTKKEYIESIKDYVKTERVKGEK